MIFISNLPAKSQLDLDQRQGHNQPPHINMELNTLVENPDFDEVDDNDFGAEVLGGEVLDIALWGSCNGEMALGNVHFQDRFKQK